MRCRFTRLSCAPAIVILLLANPATGAPPQEPVKRIALVIGNSKYAWKTPLANAAPDAQKIAARMGELGFEVSYRVDLDRNALETALSQFGARIRREAQGPVAFFYYSGHAAQDVAQINYLIPTDANASTPAQLRTQAVPLQRVLADMVRANNPVNIVVLDACRDWFSRDQSVDVPRGLHDIGRQGNMLLAMATSPNMTAEDAGQDGSPFSKRLLEGLRQDVQRSVAELFDDVQGKVYVDTDGGQAPEYINGLARAPRWSIGLAAFTGVPAIRLVPPRADTVLPALLQALDRGRLMAFTGGRTSFVDALLARRDLLAQAGIVTPAQLAYFLAWLSFESSNFRAETENLRFSASRLRTLFPSRYPTDDIAARYAGRPELIANRLYANRMGNGDESSGDGWRYRGRGYVGITGRGMYERIGRMIGVDLAAAPDLVNDPETGIAVALNLWSSQKLALAAENDDLASFTRQVSGGLIGLEKRSALLQRARKAVAPAPFQDRPG